ncbi:hypothetical protein [Streptomyces chryseus]|uniref:hypothetical protein n=1 Tax=Streptomyces chryseus TaxID=68186 RepID=UPI00110FE402|nr:hypothetical protein [Streptomyces chryseus]GGX39994.1 hypothetical protein GCM10010353_64300 [Streptomyces chryseus]
MNDVAASPLAGLSPAPVVALHQQLRSLDLPQPYARGDKAARHAAVQADAVLAWLFPHTLYAVVSAGLWRGYPPVSANRLPASAVVALGSTDGSRGWWLHYSLTSVGHDEDGDMVHTIILIAPCACGAYIDVELPDQDALVILLDELDTAPGHPVPCDWRLRIRRTSTEDRRHTSVLDEPPF